MSIPLLEAGVLQAGGLLDGVWGTSLLVTVGLLALAGLLRGLQALGTLDVDWGLADGDRRVRPGGPLLSGGPYRWLALGAIGMLTSSYVGILYHVTDVVGGVYRLGAVVGVSLVLAVVLAGRLRVRTAVGLALAFTAVGYLAYALAIPNSYLALLARGKMLSDTVTLLQGLSILRVTRADVWALSYAPGPVFLSVYLALRRRYTLAAGVGATALWLFVLTTDAGLVATLAGAVGAAAAVGFGDLERRGGGLAQADVMAAILALMIVLPATLTFVPGGAVGTPQVPGSQTTVEGTVVGAGERVSIVGSIQLSPKVRFTVTSERRDFWRVAAYDRYTGNDWIRTGGINQYPGPIQPPTGAATRVRQTYRAESAVASMPAAWRPVSVQGIGSQRVRVTDLGGLQPSGLLSDGETYTVVSQVPDYDREDLRNAGTNYPEPVVEGYTRLPESTPERLAERTDQITAGSSGPYESALRIEQWLETNKGYSLTVNRPDGNIADSFVFEMQAGYCTYFASAMVAMLRTQNVPARFVVGYAPGQRVAEDEWVVRGMDSHAWVEVYFPDVGWVKFDPTPGGPRTAREAERLERARAAEVSNVDTVESRSGEWTPTPGGPFANTTPGGQNPEIFPNGTPTAAAPNGTPGGLVGSGPQNRPGGDGGPSLPSPRVLGLSAVALAGAAAGARRAGLDRQLYRAAWLRWQPADDPADARVRRAYRRMEHLLAGRYRPRRPGETPRSYLEALWAAGMDERCRRVGSLYERAAYGGEVTDAEADEAVAVVDDLVEDGRRLGRIPGLPWLLDR